MVEIYIQNGETIYKPIIEEDVSVELERKGVPGKLTFSVVKDEVINFQEGNAVKVVVGGVNFFYGFVFTKKRGKGETIQVTAYDQLRYLKNKDTYVYSNKTVSELIQMIAKDFNLQVGDLDGGNFKIPSRVEDNKTLFDIIQSALDITLLNTKKMFVLYDDFGRLTLKNIDNMKLDSLIDSETAEDFDYSSSIEDSYNKIKLYRDNKEAGKREIYISKDSVNINNWGVLQYFESVDEKENAIVKADSLLQLYDRKTRNLSVKDALGNVKVRAGSLVPVQLNLGDLITQNYMMVEKVKHSFKENQHAMDFVLRGGDFIA